MVATTYERCYCHRDVGRLHSRSCRCFKIAASPLHVPEGLSSTKSTLGRAPSAISEEAPDACLHHSWCLCGDQPRLLARLQRQCCSVCTFRNASIIMCFSTSMSGLASTTIRAVKRHGNMCCRIRVGQLREGAGTVSPGYHLWPGLPAPSPQDAVLAASTERWLRLATTHRAAPPLISPPFPNSI